MNPRAAPGFGSPARPSPGPASGSTPRRWSAGEDLRDLGLQPGPDYRRILGHIRVGQLNGELTTRGEALEEVERMENRED